MRKVKPKDEIPVKFLQPEAAQKRINNFNNTKIKRDVQKVMIKLNNWMNSINGKSIDTDDFLERIYKAADIYMEQQVYPISVCAKGCAHCCTVIPVEATAIEMSYIAEKSGIDIELDWNAPHSKGANRPVPESEPCPLLDTRTATCKVYEHRPLQCRLFASLDHHELCEDPEGEHYTHTPRSNQFWNLVLGNIAMASYLAAEERKITPVADIRDWVVNR